MKRKTSCALTEVRTVVSRAETALEAIRDLPQQRERLRDSATRVTGKSGEAMRSLTGFYAQYAEDADEPEMIAALEQVVALLERWR